MIQIIIFMVLHVAVLIVLTWRIDKLENQIAELRTDLNITRAWCDKCDNC